MRRLFTSAALFLCVWQACAAPPLRAEFSLPAFPVEFEANRGQHDAAVRFFARASGYQVALTQAGVLFALPAADQGERSTVALRFSGTPGNAVLAPERPTAHKTHYFLGDAAQQQFKDIANFERVAYRSIYPGVDAVFYGRGGKVEYDLVLQPGADPHAIALEFAGAGKIEVDAEGDLLVHAAQGVLRQHKPFVYQVRGGERQAVPSQYRLLPGGKVGVELAGYDERYAVTVDPVLSYSTYLGGTLGESGNAIAVDAAGNAYITGVTSSTNFPAVGAYQGTLAGTADVFVAKLNPQGTGLVYSTYIGGRRSYSEGRAITVDANGSAYITGTTSAGSYPVTAGALSAGVSAGGAFVTKLSPAGNALVYSTYLPGASPLALRVDGAGSAYVAGQSFGGLPATSGALQAALPPGSAGSGFVAKLNPAGSALAYATYLGGAGENTVNGIAVDALGTVYATGATTADNFPVTAGVYQGTRRGGREAFVSRLDAAGHALLFSTYLGGAADDNAMAIAVDGNGRMYVAGDTYSTDFPRVDGYSKPYNSTAYNVAFVTVLNADAATLAMSTYLGGKACLPPQGGSCFPWDPTDGATAIAVDAAGRNIHVAGYLSSLDVSWLANAIQAGNSGRYDAFVAKIEVDPFSQRILNIRYATRLGGNGDERVSGMAVDPQGNAYITGSADSTTFPTTQGTYRVASPGPQDVFVAKVATWGQPIVLEGGCDGTLTSHLRASLAGDASGTVAFQDNGVTLTTVPVTGGSAAYVAAAAVGTHKYTAVHSASGAVSAPVYCQLDQ
jgi:hypothetical protein